MGFGSGIYFISLSEWIEHLILLCVFTHIWLFIFCTASQTLLLYIYIYIYIIYIYIYIYIYYIYIFCVFYLLFSLLHPPSLSLSLSLSLSVCFLSFFFSLSLSIGFLFWLGVAIVGMVSGHCLNKANPIQCSVAEIGLFNLPFGCYRVHWMIARVGIVVIRVILITGWLSKSMIWWSDLYVPTM